MQTERVCSASSKPGAIFGEAERSARGAPLRVGKKSTGGMPSLVPSYSGTMPVPQLLA